MYKSIIAYNVTTMPSCYDGITNAKFAPCTAMQEQSIGFVPVEGDALTYVDNTAVHFKVRKQVKTIPSAVIKTRLADHVAETGEVLSKAKKRELVDKLRSELLARVLPTDTFTEGYFDLQRKLLVIHTPSHKTADAVIRLLFRALDDVTLGPIVIDGLSSKITDWVYRGTPDGVALGESLNVIDIDDSKISFRQSGLLRSDIHVILAQGGKVESLQVVIGDTTATITKDFTLKQIKHNITNEQELSDFMLTVSSNGTLLDTLLGCLQ